MNIVSIKENSGLPKYKQIVSSIENAITSGLLKKGDKLPSINNIKNKHALSRDTVLSAFNVLKTRGIIQSIVGKGYYVTSENIDVEKKVFLLFDELNAFKDDLYNSFLSNLDKNIKIDIFFHHFNFDVFNKLISDNIGNYNYYVIMPANLKNTDLVINKLPADKVYILDQTHKELSQYPAIYQNFKKNIKEGLTNCLNLIKNYSKLILVFPEKKQPQGMLKGFKAFCKENNINNEVIPTIKGKELEYDCAYVVPDDRILIRILKKSKEENMILAKDFGIISYNDTILKEFVEGGITTISTDFYKMGEQLAQMIMNNENKKIINPNKVIIRNSI
jgi:DNA-binding transcriptional regulator YhcF (GntR family)